ncbi:DEAD/DEAH box helicase [Bifidobacterium margollesii]|uniref:DEAD/DEAH box helicase n=1 Tax=Bifidobacterium margollesii TaxID=2020964 RepID=A0A2N5J8D9_9BIFI|nr:DEAD/DEAH box helicase [Bifidobacterium margollesii]
MIQRGEHALVIAPTGSGKTLSAFLWAIDGLLARGLPSQDPHAMGLPDRSDESGIDDPAVGDRHDANRPGVKVLYVSPLKALGVDVAKNLERPLRGITEEYAARGQGAFPVRVAIRTGDTTARQRRAIAAHPPDILVTTPESLYLMLTSKACSVLRTVRMVIVDEVHAMAGTKRGAHLSVSLERLDALAEGDVQRVGLSATVNPPAEVARFLGGDRTVTIVDAGRRSPMDLRVVEPLPDMRDLSSTVVAAGGDGFRSVSIPSEDDSTSNPRSSTRNGGRVGSGGSIWPFVERGVLEEILRHRTTLVFVNSRGLAEKLTARLNDLYAQRSSAYDERGSAEGRSNFSEHYDAVVGSSTMLVGSHDGDEVIAMAHHGSVSKERRKQIEENLKQGRLRCVVATSSLELGIDMGSVDLVIQIAPPLSVSSGLQRVGRADHRVGGVSRALFYPLTRAQILDVATDLECMTEGNIEPVRIPTNPLDILAQQTVAAASMHDLDADDWYGLIRRSAPFAELDRRSFDAVLGMMSGDYNSEEFSAFRPRLAWNHENNMISALPGAQRIAVTSGGTIPDRGLYTVMLPESESGGGPRRVGELDEEMVYESRVGDIITLGASTWQIRQITRDRVIVVPAPGRTSRLPFWHGEGPGRDYAFGVAKGRVTRELAAGLIGGDHAEAASANIGDETGSRIGMPAFDERTERRLRNDGLDENSISNLATLLDEQRRAIGVVPDDGHLIVERYHDEDGGWRVMLHSPYGRRVHEPWALAIAGRLSGDYGFDGHVYAADDGIVIQLPDGDGEIDLQRVLRFDPDEIRGDVARRVGGSVLFASRFRECAARSLFMPRVEPGRRVPLWQQRLRAAQLLQAARAKRNFPLLLETARECLRDVYDLPSLCGIMRDLASGRISMSEVETESPSPFARNVLFGFVGEVMYQYDQPQAERAAQLLSMDPQVLERLLGEQDLSAVLDARSIREVEEELSRHEFWNELDEHDVRGRVARYAKTHGPFTADEAVRDLGLGAQDVVHALDEMYENGELLSGRFTTADTDDSHCADDSHHADDSSMRQWLHVSVFRRIRARSLDRARRAIRPVSLADYQRFLLDRQGVGPVGGERYEGVDGLMKVIEQLEGMPLPAGLWETDVFPVRVRDYRPEMLDELLSSGEVVWVGSKAAGSSSTGRIAFYPADSPLLPNHSSDAVTDGRSATGEDGGSDDGDGGEDHDGDGILDLLNTGGAYHARQLKPASMDAAAFSDRLWQLVWQGRVTNSGFAAVRAMISRGRSRRNSPVGRARTIRAVRRPRIGVAGGSVAAGRHPFAQITLTGMWSLVPEGSDEPARRVVAMIETLLDGYGVVCAPLLELLNERGGFSRLYPVLRRMEERGTILRGMFVEGLGAAQFAARDTVEALRGMSERSATQTGGRRDARAASVAAVDALDPANLVGAVMPWPRVGNMMDVESERALHPTRREGAMLVLIDGSATLYAAVRSHHLLVFGDAAGPEDDLDDGGVGEDRMRRACAELAYAIRRRYRSTRFLSDVNGYPLTSRSRVRQLLHAAGFVPSPQGMTLYP